jgi:DnaJ family protein A protein 5
MGQGDSHEGPTAHVKARTMTCHYEVLELDRDCTEAEIKKAYRKLALKYHPDKNVGNEEEATKQFRLVQAANECLSDPKERRWYDEHREDMLRGGDGTKKEGGDGDDYVAEILHLFKRDCFDDYDDDEFGFFTVYREAFEEIDQMERDTFERENGESAVPDEAQSFGRADSDYDDVGDFYRRWESFSSILSFSWEDIYDPRDAPDRRYRRAMEQDNERSRRQAKKE